MNQAVGSCPVCGGYPKAFQRRGYAELYCRVCGFLWQDPPAPDVVELLADDPYWWLHDGGGQTPVYGRLLDEAERRLGRRGVLLDVGCGLGGMLIYAADRGWEAVGIDITADSVNAATERGAHAEVAEVCDYQLGRQFDLVCFVDSLECSSHPDRQLGAARRLLRPGGLVAIATPNTAWHVRARRIGASRFFLAPDGAHRSVAFASRSLAALMAASGFRTVAVAPSPGRGTGAAALARKALGAAAVPIWRATGHVVSPSLIATGVAG